MGLLATTSIAIDGSKFKAVNNRDKNFTRAKVERRRAQLEESVARYLSVSVHFLHVVSVQRGRWAPVPRQKLVEAAHWVPIGHTFEHIPEICEGLDVIELG